MTPDSVTRPPLPSRPGAAIHITEIDGVRHDTVGAGPLLALRTAIPHVWVTPARHDPMSWIDEARITGWRRAAVVDEEILDVLMGTLTWIADMPISLPDASRARNKARAALRWTAAAGEVVAR